MTASVPPPVNEPVLGYLPGSPERAQLASALSALSAECPEIPVIAGARSLTTGRLLEVSSPHRWRHVLARAHEAGPAETQQAIDAAIAAWPAWSALRFEDRAAIFLRAADLLAGRYRARVNAACMLGQSKTAHQAEIDAVCELVDFFRFNVAFLRRMLDEQPLSPPGAWNRSELRPLEGFVYAVAPFNFLSIAVNLPAAPILCGNVAVWKPATASLRGCWEVLGLLREAGLPDGVLNLVPGHGPEQSEVVLASPHLAGIHFTGSTATFRALWRGVADRLEQYRSFPRLVGETGGKDFILAHPSADLDALAAGILRGGFEYQGQKCSAASRIYVPRSLWPALRERLADETPKMNVGDPTEFSTFLGAVIDRRAFDRITSYQALARSTASVLVGGTANDAEGFFVDPTIALVDDPHHRLVSEEIFGPLVTVFVYEDARWEETLAVVDGTSPYALTGAVFSTDRAALAQAERALRHAAGNYYVNDKPTGAVVGQQPFGGGRASGTNDKAGAFYNLARWISPRSIKETLTPPRDWRYPFLAR